MTIVAGTACPLQATEPAKLSPRPVRTIDLVFPEPTRVTEMYRAWSKLTGIEVLPDPELREQATTVAIHGATALSSLDGLARICGHFHRVLDEHTVVIVDDTPEKRHEYHAFETRTFPLKHTEAQTMLGTLSNVLGVRYAAATRGRIVLMDTSPRLGFAEKILQMSDTQEPEVMIDVELLMIKRLAGTPLPRRLLTGEKRQFERTTSARTVTRSRVNAFGGASTHLPVDGAPPETGIDLELKARRDSAPAVVQGDTVAEIILDLHLRASGVLGVVENDGREVPAYNRRQLATTVRLRAGETYLLPGLTPASGELVVALTPQRVRPPKGSGGAPMIWMEPSDELNLDAVWGRPNKAISARERVRERLRERLRSLPRGLQDAEPSEQQAQDDP